MQIVDRAPVKRYSPAEADAMIRAMDRRPGHRFNRGRASTGGASGPAPTDPLATMGAGATVAWWRSDVVVGSPVSEWSDQGPNNFDLTEAVDQPAYNAAGGPNGTPSILFDGTNDKLLNAAIDRPAPGTEPTFYWSVMRQVTWTNTRRICGCSTVSGAMILLQNGTTPNIAGSDGTVGPNTDGLTLNTYKRVEAYFSNSASDYVKAGATSNGTGIMGSTNPVARFVLGCSGALTLFSNIEVCEFAIFNALPSAAQLASLDAYTTGRYGAGLV